MKKLNTKLKAFSILETIVTLAIFGILMAMLSQVILINISVSRKTFARARIREELAEVVSLIQRDVRNATLVTKCEKLSSGVSQCIMSHKELLVWTDSCPVPTGGDPNIKRVCRKTGVVDPNNPSSGTVTYTTSDILNIKTLAFDINLQVGTDGTKSTILITLLADATNENFEVKNQVRQSAISTRNYTLGQSGPAPSVTPTPTVTITTSPSPTVQVTASPSSSPSVVINATLTPLAFCNQNSPFIGVAVDAGASNVTGLSGRVLVDRDGNLSSPSDQWAYSANAVNGQWPIETTSFQPISPNTQPTSTLFTPGLGFSVFFQTYHSGVLQQTFGPVSITAPNCAVSCLCSGGVRCGGAPISPSQTYCGYRVCGADFQFYTCEVNGWISTGQPCACQ